LEVGETKIGGKVGGEKGAIRQRGVRKSQMAETERKMGQGDNSKIAKNAVEGKGGRNVSLRRDREKEEANEEKNEKQHGG